jgi:SpoIIAA-like
MIEILESPKHLVAFKLSANLTAEDITIGSKTTQDALKQNERVSFFADIDSSVTLTWEGVIKDISEGLKHFGKLSRYYRAAVVTDKGWLGAMARVEGLVFSSIEMRVFAPGDREKAFAWASEEPGPLPKPESPSPSVRFLPTTNKDVFAYEVNGRLRAKDLKETVKTFKPYLERDDKVNVLAKLKDFNGFDILAVLEDDVLKLKYKSLSKVEKYAIVGAKPWMRNFLELLAPMFSTKIRIFDLSEEADAWDWVGAKQAHTAK